MANDFSSPTIFLFFTHTILNALLLFKDSEAPTVAPHFKDK